MSDKGLYEEFTIAGFGGQGIILTGKLLAHTAMKAGKEVTYMPSYGAEVRGGTANCMVIIAEKNIASPVISNPTSLIAMNKASLNKFAPRLKKNGILILNSSLIDTNPPEDTDTSVKVLTIPVDKIAGELKSPRSANMVALGAYLQARGIIDWSQTADCLEQVLAKRYHKTIPVNTKALQTGAEYAQKHS